MKQQNRTRLIRSAAVAGVLLAGVVGQQAQAQTSDALIDKLVEKGILTVKEAKDLREEADAGFAKATQAKTGQPDWITQMKLYGDFRGRYEQINLDNGLAVDRNRFRYRLRAGATVTMLDNVEAGFRLTSSEGTGPNGTFGGDPISGNTTFGNNASKKFVFIDLAYGKWTPINHNGLSIGGTIGKMENPFTTSDMIFDQDYTPEGAALQASYALNDQHSLKGNFGAFVLQESSGSPQDPWMLGTQVRWDGKDLQREGYNALESSLGASWYGITAGTGTNQNLMTSAVPDKNTGNTRDESGGLIYKYAPLVDASVTYNLASMPFYRGTFPIKLGGEYIYNPGAGAYLQEPSNSTENYGWWVGVTLGKMAKRGSWEVNYRYEWLGGDAWWEELTDSDFGAGNYNAAQTGASYASGTNIKGHIIKASYAITDAMSFSVKYWMTDQVFASGPKTGASRLQADLNWKF